MSIVPVFSPASPQAKVIVDLFYIVLGVCAVILTIVTGLITWSLLRFRGRADSPEPRQTFGSVPVEVAWTLIPLLVVICLFVLTARAMNQSDPLPAQLRADLVITGHQWWWEARYPNSGVVAANEIHIPAGARWLVRLEAADVIHDFWAPRLGRKMDMIPGHPNYIWLEAQRPGTYSGACAEYCGAQHSWMRFSVIAQPPGAFEQWQQEQLRPLPTPASGPGAQGEKLFSTLTCANCHSVGQAAARPSIAPDLTHLAGRQTLAGGVLENTPANLVRWLRSPQAIKPGSLMPNLQLTQQQAAELAAYLEPQKQ
ncbi:MAG TPA: cytochrome c oxidase subunit II [Verrucomicrobiae bacterium]|nr:cytochrome c oxidase subunit II [Verrucomicrobiae bacterium]